MNGEINWIFFAAQAKPSSMRRAIAERLAERERVVIVEQPVSLVRDRAFMPLKGRCIPFGKEGNSWHYRPLHFPEKLSGMGGIFRALNGKLIQKEIDRLLPPQADRIVCYDSPTQHPLVKKFRERKSVYLAIDDRTLSVSGASIPGELEAERKLLGRVDKVICVSAPLAKTLGARLPKGRSIPLHILPNGYDERLFDPNRIWNEPLNLQPIPHPRVLVTGHLSERIDWKGITDSIRKRPEWTWIFVGPADDGIPEKIKKISKITWQSKQNIVWQNQIPIHEIPAWIAHVDACAVPYQLNAFTLASSPLKAIEYLAMGAPVLSTCIPALKSYEKLINWVEEDDGNSYAQALDNVSEKGLHSVLARFFLDGIESHSWKVKSRIFKGLVTEALSIQKDLSNTN